jgi:hypothetical protein
MGQDGVLLNSYHNIKNKVALALRNSKLIGFVPTFMA